MEYSSAKRWCLAALQSANFVPGNSSLASRAAWKKGSLAALQAPQPAKAADISFLQTRSAKPATRGEENGRLTS